MMRENLAEKTAETTFPDYTYGRLQNSVVFDFAALSQNVALARTMVAALIANCQEAGWDMTISALEEIKVAVSEAVSNAIIHAYPGSAQAAQKGCSDEAPQVHMQLWQYQRALVVRVSDDGVGIADVRKAMEPAFTTGQEHLGLGFAFMSSFMDKVEVQSQVGQGTVVTLIKQI